MWGKKKNNVQEGRGLGSQNSHQNSFSMDIVYNPISSSQGEKSKLVNLPTGIGKFTCRTMPLCFAS